MSVESTELEVNSLTPANTYSRRTFIVTSLGAGFALGVQPVMAQTAISTPADGLVAGEIKVAAQGGEMVAYRAAPAGAISPPVILVVQEIFGVHEYIRDICRRLAKLGYLAIAPELFARQGDPRKYSAIPDLMSNIVSKVPDGQVMADLDACLAAFGDFFAQRHFEETQVFAEAKADVEVARVDALEFEVQHRVAQVAAGRGIAGHAVDHDFAEPPFLSPTRRIRNEWFTAGGRTRKIGQVYNPFRHPLRVCAEQPAASSRL